MTKTLDLTAVSAPITLAFNVYYRIEEGWDYAYVTVQDGSTLYRLAGNVTTTHNANGQNLGNGITGFSSGWVAAQFDLSAFSGKQITLGVQYVTDGAVFFDGIYVDDVTITAGSTTLFADNVEGAPGFALDGFVVDDGKRRSEHYYLLEWRTHGGVDAGLKHISIGGGMLRYEQGLLVWYVDHSFADNRVALHPSEGFIGVVDADQWPVMFTTESEGEEIFRNTYFQIHDAPFNTRLSRPLWTESQNSNGATFLVWDLAIFPHPTFDDRASFVNADMPQAGRLVPQLGLRVSVPLQSLDGRSALVVLRR